MSTSIANNASSSFAPQTTPVDDDRGFNQAKEYLLSVFSSNGTLRQVKINKLLAPLNNSQLRAIDDLMIQLCAEKKDQLERVNLNREWQSLRKRFSHVQTAGTAVLAAEKLSKSPHLDMNVNSREGLIRLAVFAVPALAYLFIPFGWDFCKFLHQKKSMNTLISSSKKARMELSRKMKENAENKFEGSQLAQEISHSSAEKKGKMVAGRSPRDLDSENKKCQSQKEDLNHKSAEMEQDILIRDSRIENLKDALEIFEEDRDLKEIQFEKVTQQRNKLAQRLRENDIDFGDLI